MAVDVTWSHPLCKPGNAVAPGQAAPLVAEAADVAAMADGVLGSVNGDGAGAAPGLSSPSNDGCRCNAASARNWATGGKALREESMGRDMPDIQWNECPIL